MATKRADELVVGDVIVDTRGKKVKLIEVEKLRRGGYEPEARTIIKKGKKRRSDRKSVV